MRPMRIGLLALAMFAAATFSSCSKAKSSAWEPLAKIDPAKLEAQIDALKTESFALKGGVEADVNGVIAALPKLVKVTIEKSEFDPANGATAVTGVRITPQDRDDVGVMIQQVRFWGLDTEFAKARLAGQRLDETATLARRIEVTGASAFGLANLMSPVMDAYTSTVGDAVGGAAGLSAEELGRELDVNIKRYDLSMSRFIVDDVVLRPYVLAPRQLAADNDWAEVFPYLQGYAALWRAFAADTLALYDMKFELVMDQAGGEAVVLVAIDSTASRGVRGGDSDFALTRGVRLDFKAPAPPVAPAPPPLPSEGDTVEAEATDPATLTPPIPFIRMNGSMDRITQQGVRTDKLLDHLARGVMPARTEADLLSLGVTKYAKQQFYLNDRPVYSVDEATFDGSGFHWFIPTRLRFDASNVVYDVKGFLDLGRDLNPAEFEGAEATIGPVMETLAKYGLDKPSLDFAIDWQWDAKTGAAKIGLDYGLDQYLRFDFGFDGRFPSFDAVSALIPANFQVADPAPIEALFQKDSVFSAATLDVTDEGGIAKAFALAIDIAKIMPDTDQGANFLRNSTPENLRQMASSGIFMAGGQMAEEAPAAKAVIDAVAGFIGKGGKLHIELKPKEPMPWTAFSDPGFASDPRTALETLGLAATHTAPPAAEDAKDKAQ